MRDYDSMLTLKMLSKEICIIEYETEHATNSERYT